MSLNPLPGAPDKETQLERIIRVDHAGEYGAKRIYEGQLAILKGKAAEPTIRHMSEQEQKHLEAFEALMREKHVRPTALMPFWHVGGFLMGAMTAMMGEKAAMACTVAVEEVIDGHYKRQQEALEGDEEGLKELVTQFRQEEQEHRDIGLEHGAEQATAYPLLRSVVGGITKAAIWLSERV